MTLRLRFWLLCLDVALALGGDMGSRRFRLQQWCIGKVSDATDWGSL